MSVHGCLQECRGLHGCKKFASSGVGRVYMMCEWISTRFSNNEFSEFFLETRVQVSVAFNTYPIRILNISLSFFFRMLVLKYDFFFAKWILFCFSDDYYSGTSLQKPKIIKADDDSTEKFIFNFKDCEQFVIIGAVLGCCLVASSLLMCFLSARLMKLTKRYKR